MCNDNKQVAIYNIETPILLEPDSASNLNSKKASSHHTEKKAQNQFLIFLHTFFQIALCTNCM